MADRFLRATDVVRETGLSRTTIWRHVKAKRFPKPRRIGPNSVAWRESEVDAWKASRPFAEGPANA